VYLKLLFFFNLADVFIGHVGHVSSLLLKILFAILFNSFCLLACTFSVLV